MAATVTFGVDDTHSPTATYPPTQGPAHESGVLVDADEELPITEGSVGSVDEGRYPALQHVEVGDGHHPGHQAQPG
jgi:hypothetical protein